MIIPEKIYNRIKKIQSEQSKKIDLLKLHQNVDQRSTLILKNAQHLLIYARLEKAYPKKYI
eukprot:COSAG01_NODE_27620_length_681_cov_0.798969_1_plen_61_part_00